MKIKCVNVGANTGITDGKAYEVIQATAGACEDFYEIINDNGDKAEYYQRRFEIVKEEKEEVQFDMKKEPWYIRVANEQEFNTVKDWVESLGFKFKYGNKYEEDIVAISNYLNSRGEVESIIHKNKAQDDQSEYNEIKVTFKTLIDSVTLPEVKTEQQKQIEELEKTILLAKQQIEELKKRE